MKPQMIVATSWSQNTPAPRGWNWPIVKLPPTGSFFVSEDDHHLAAGTWFVQRGPVKGTQVVYHESQATAPEIKAYAEFARPVREARLALRRARVLC